jgi:hypothetical protein
MYAYKNDAEQLEGRQDPDDFLQKFITSDDELLKRMACCCLKAPGLKAMLMMAIVMPSTMQR